MSWQDILKINFSFESLKSHFKEDIISNKLRPEFAYRQHLEPPPKKLGWIAKYEVNPHITISVVAGVAAYSTPREYLDDPMAYEAYEMGFHVNGEFQDTGPYEYQTKKEIEDVVNGGYLELLASDEEDEFQ